MLRTVVYAAHLLLDSWSVAQSSGSREPAAALGAGDAAASPVSVVDSHAGGPWDWSHAVVIDSSITAVARVNHPMGVLTTRFGRRG